MTDKARSSIARYYTAFGYKRLSAVEVDASSSNQHEFQGVARLREMFGTEKRKIRARFLFMSEERDAEVVQEEVELTWYDSRENQPHRSPEFRLYYPADFTEVQDYARKGDLILIATRPDDSCDVIVADENSTYERQVLWLFGVDEDSSIRSFLPGNSEALERRELDFAARRILETLGIEVPDEDEALGKLALEKFPHGFPTTRIFSDFARSTLPHVNARENPDEAIMQWLDREELLFRTLERHIVASRLQHGFGGTVPDVDGFIEFSLSVQNRRKSRVGRALENHLEQLFQIHEIRHTRGGRTEGNSRPDFIFPGIEQYQDPAFDPLLLTMLGVKSTCKDRWRQVLAEAKRIPTKHLFTLEPGISQNQTAEMRQHQLTLVLPSALHNTFTPLQRPQLVTVREFLNLIRLRQDGPVGSV